MGATRSDFIRTLDEARDHHCREGFECAKKGLDLPGMPDLDALCGHMVEGAGPMAGDAGRFWEERRQRLKDAVHALGLVEPGLQKIGSSLRTGSPCKAASAIPRNTPGKSGAGAAPTPTESKKRKMPPTPSASSAAKKAAAGLAGSTRPTATPRAQGDDHGDVQKPAKPASKDIKPSHWNSTMTRRLMAANQFKHDLSKDYVMPLALPAFTFNKAQQQKRGRR